MALSLDSLVTSEHEPPMMIVYGPRGVGKTTFAASAPRPVMIRTERVGHFPGVQMFPQAESFEDVMDALRALATEEHDFQTLIVDSLDWLQTLVWKHLITKRPTDEKGRQVKSIEDYGFGKGYIHALDYWSEYLRAIEYLRSSKGVAIVQIAHAEVKRFDDPTSDSYDRYQIKLHARASDKLQEAADAVLFAKAKHAVRTEEVGFNNERKLGTGQGERFLYTDARPAFDAKNRYGLPHEILMPQSDGYAAVAKLIPYYAEQKKGPAS